MNVYMKPVRCCPVSYCPVMVVVRSKMTQISHQKWGEVSGLGTVDLWVLQSSQVRVEVLTLGAIIRSVSSRGKDGQMEDVVLGYDDLEGKKKNNWLLPHIVVDCIQKKQNKWLDYRMSCECAAGTASLKNLPLK